MKTWFTGDTHFGHANIIKHCSRPFESADEMDAAMIANWNSVVGPRDVTWHLGDFACRSTKNPCDILKKLHGQRHLIHGNHDGTEIKKSGLWASSQQMAEITVDGVRLVLCHYAMRTWNRRNYGALQLYGHSHGNIPADKVSCDVGVDVWDFRPVSLQEIQERMEATNFAL